MIIQRLQHLLTYIYDLGDIPDATDFLISTPPSRTPSSITVGHRETSREAVYLHQEGDVLEMGLYVHPDILRRLEHEPADTHVDDLGCVAEGVSHFLYLSDRHLHGRDCSALELELQAEVDKFLLRAFVAVESRGVVPSDLFHRQFESVTYASDLSDSERDRYETANHFAAKYCHHLAERYVYPFRRQELIHEVRPFFRQGLREKVERLIP